MTPRGGEPEAGGSVPRSVLALVGPLRSEAESLMLATHDALFVWGNYLEACLWWALAVFAFSKAPAGVRLALAAALVAFGLSDVVEVQTGAWYRPWWLLAWKAACVLVFAGAGLRHWRSAGRARLHSTPKAE